MKANEFVKKFGWDGAYDLWCGAFLLFENNLCILSGVVCSLSDNKPLFHLIDLKHLFESHELVEKHGGLLSSKYYYEKYKDMGSESNIILFSAIADVESCL